MAGGKLTPRQKMINLMYLVFIAMLALNMSKEVLSAFGILNKKLVESNRLTTARNDYAFKELSKKAEEQSAQFGDKKVKVEKIRVVCKDFYNYVENLKSTSSKEFDLNEEGVFEKMDKGDYFDNLFFNGDKVSKEGKEFLDKINNFSLEIKKIGGKDIAETETQKIINRFSTAPVKSKKAGATLSWIDYNFKGFPLIATITKLSQLQADIKTTESDIISGMFQTSLVSAATLTKYVPIVVPDKTAFFEGETVTGKVILGKFDPDLVAKSVIVNGVSVKAEAGQASFSFRAGSLGENKITGSFNFDEYVKDKLTLVSLPITGNYVVVPKPNSAAISSDNMKIIYQEVDNPMSISFGGVQNNNVIASAVGLKKVGNDGKYIWNVGKLKEKIVSVTVNAKLPDGKTVSDKQTFKVRPVPKPALTLNGDSGLKVGKASELADATLGINFGSFGEGYKISGKVTSVTLTMQGKSPISISGAPGGVSISDNASAVAALKTLPKGSIVYITATYLQNNGSRKEDAYACSFKIN